MTDKQIRGYIRAARGGVLNGITFNDAYNVPTFGLTMAEYNTIGRAMQNTYGLCPTLTAVAVRKALS